MLRQKPNRKKLILGLTGSFGSGKTTVAKVFKSFGAEIIDADKLAHECLIPKSPAYKKIIGTFGKEILRKNKLINRRRLGEFVFSNKNLLRKLNNIIHPQVIGIIENRIRNSKSKVIVLDAPLLIESGLTKIIDKLIVVKIDRDKQIKRIQGKTSLGRPDILKRIKSQIPLSRKVRLAHFVIDNSGTKKKTRKQVGQIRRILWKN
jgi:dephospho-CoA kinase